MESLHVRFADEAVCIGPNPPGQSYLNLNRIISAAEITSADAIHPGYGFLSENAEFAEAVVSCGIGWIGPSPSAIERMGNKSLAKDMMRQANVPVVPGSDGAVSEEEVAIQVAAEVGYPVIIKAASGGGGRGMRVARDEDDLANALLIARAEAESAFGDPSVYIERYLPTPRHVEVQLLADTHGNTVHLGERECSIQRRHQKLIEESPCIALKPETRDKLLATAVQGARAIGYNSAGTMEFLVQGDEFFFMEMNTRIQVEHPVTEMVTGVDLVVEQIRAAAGEKLELPDTRNWKFRGHAIECRVMAEDPETFAPWPGKITEYHSPGGTGVRVDSGVFGGWVVPSTYDSLLAKVIVHAPTREKALSRMQRALDEYIIGGIRTNIPLQKVLLADQQVIDGTMTTASVERIVAEWKASKAAKKPAGDKS
jgi:acetyl-CoA carboxylase biotin carboxylase subunit